MSDEMCVMDDNDPAILTRIRCVCVRVCVKFVFFFSSLFPFPFVCCFSFVIQMSLYDLHYMTMVTMIVTSVCKCVCCIKQC